MALQEYRSDYSAVHPEAFTITGKDMRLNIMGPKVIFSEINSKMPFLHWRLKMTRPRNIFQIAVIQASVQVSNQIPAFGIP